MTTHGATPQAPIDSGYGPQSTAAEVLRDAEVRGKLAIVTGGYSGLGLEITRGSAVGALGRAHRSRPAVNLVA